MAPLVLAVILGLGAQQPAPQTPQPPTAEQSRASSSEDLPVSLDRIQRALAAPAPVELKEQHPVFRLEVFGRKPTLEDVLGEKFWVGATPYGGMTHQEFLNMVTPKEAQGLNAFTGKYLVAQAALTLAEQWALKQAIHRYQNAREEREREAARKEVMDALAALEKARRDAGLDK